MVRIKHLIKAVLIHAVINLCFAYALIPRRQKAPKYFFFSLTKEQSIRDESLGNLFDFLNDERFGFDATSNNSIVEIRNLKYIWPRNKISVTYDIALHLLFRCTKRAKLLKIYIDMLKKTYIKGAGTFSALEWKRNVFDLLIWQKFLNGNSLEILLFTTQSSALRLPPVFLLPKKENVKKIMFWYGTNTEPIERTSNVEKTHTNASLLNNCIDQHYVWDEFQREILKSKGLLNIEAKGSILFLPRKAERFTFEFPTIIYFDVTPVTKSIHEDIYISTLVGIVTVCDEISQQTNTKIKILVKPKRMYAKNHSKKYIQLLKNLQIDEQLEILDPTSDTYSLIESAKLTLGMVFTSPVLIAKELNKPGAFVALNGTHFPDRYNDMKVISNATELKKIILSTLELDL